MPNDTITIRFSSKWVGVLYERSVATIIIRFISHGDLFGSSFGGTGFLAIRLSMLAFLSWLAEFSLSFRVAVMERCKAFPSLSCCLSTVRLRLPGRLRIGVVSFFVTVVFESAS